MKLLGLSILFTVARASLDLSLGSTVYINALGQEVVPQQFEWGRVAVKEKDAAKTRHCGMIDGSGRLGRRQSYCPGGYTLACDSSQDFPCCPTDTPQCCPDSTVCCGTDQVCSGRSTCCAAGQTGCGEACCNYGETCCGTNCCSTGFTCSNGSCVAPGQSSVPTTLAPSTTVSVTTGLVRAATGTTTLLDTTSQTTLTRAASSSSQPANDHNSNDNNDHSSSSDSINVPHGPSPATLGGAIGGSLGGLTAILGLIAAWWHRKKQQAQKALEALKKEGEEKCQELKPPVIPTQESQTSVHTSVKEPEPYDVPATGDTWVERPAIISAGMGGHGSSYT